MIYEPLTAQIIAACIEVHGELGPGLLESVYESALCIEFFHRGLHFHRQKQLPVCYKGQNIGDLKLDLLVEDTVVVELKSVERHDPVFEAQLLTYMKLGGYKVGLLVNFNSLVVSKSIKRLTLG